MSVTRLFVEAGLSQGADVALSEAQAHHLRHVMRRADGAELFAPGPDGVALLEALGAGGLLIDQVDLVDPALLLRLRELALERLGALTELHLDAGGTQALFQELAEKYPDRYRDVAKKLIEIHAEEAVALTPAADAFDYPLVVSA